MLQVKALGSGYNAIYRATPTPRGWCFMQKDGTYLTPGIGYPMYYKTPEELLAAVQRTCKAEVTVITGSGGKPE